MKVFSILCYSYFVTTLVCLTSILATFFSFAQQETTSTTYAPGEIRCPHAPNTIPIYTEAPILIKQVKNGKLFMGGNKSSGDEFYIQSLFGTYYEMGFAIGELNKDILPGLVTGIYDWLAAQAEAKVPWIPANVMQIIVDVGADVALAWAWSNVESFVPQKYKDELQGIADASGVKLQDIINCNMLPVIIRAQCSAILAHDQATMNSHGGSVIHLRTLDGMGGDTLPFKNAAAISYYHSAASYNESIVSSFSWLGFAGVVTGISYTQNGDLISLGEKAWNDQKWSHWHGLAWTYLTREFLTKNTYAESVTFLKNANRTCSIHLATASRANNQIDGWEVAADLWYHIGDDNINYPQHPALPGMIYWDFEGQPSPFFCFADMFKRLYGNITAEALALDVAPRLGTGDLHAVIWDHNAGTVLFANARKTNVTTGEIKACHRQYTRVNMTTFFLDTPPNV